MTRSLLALLGCVLASLPVTASATEPTLFMLSGGAFDANKQVNSATEFGLQWRGGRRLWHLGPMAGAMTNSDAAFHGYAGFSLDFQLGRQVAVRGSFAPGYYAKGDGKDLHGALQFRSALEAGWRFGKGLRLGLELYHLSNLGLEAPNPGEESLALTLALPADRIFGH